MLFRSLDAALRAAAQEVSDEVEERVGAEAHKRREAERQARAADALAKRLSAQLQGVEAEMVELRTAMRAAKEGMQMMKTIARIRGPDAGGASGGGGGGGGAAVRRRGSGPSPGGKARRGPTAKGPPGRGSVGFDAVAQKITGVAEEVDRRIEEKRRKRLLADAKALAATALPGT